MTVLRTTPGLFWTKDNGVLIYVNANRVVSPVGALIEVVCSCGLGKSRDSYGNSRCPHGKAVAKFLLDNTHEIDILPEPVEL